MGLQIRVPGLRDILGQRGLGLFDLGFIGTRIDQEKRIAPLNELAFGEVRPRDLPIDLGFDRDGRVSLRAPDHADLNRHGCLNDLGDRHRHRFRLMLDGTPVFPRAGRKRSHPDEQVWNQSDLRHG